MIAVVSIKLALTGAVKKFDGLPYENSIARRKYSSSIGPRMKPSNSGVGSQSSR